MAVPATLLLVPFSEPDDDLLPRDAAGNLDALNVEAGISMPVVADALTGRGRNFVAASSRALLAADLPDGDTLATRDATVQVLTSLRATSGAAWPRAVYVRGLGDGTAAERYALGLEVAKLALPVNPVVLELRLFWHDGAGNLKTQIGGTFRPAGDAEFVLLTATRRWVSSTEVVLRYYVNDQLLSEVVSADGDIAGATTGTTSIGARKNAGAWARFWDGVIDELKVTNFEMSHEEVAAVWERITVHQPAATAALTALMPPGSGWGSDPTNRWGKLVRIAGQALGAPLATVEELRANWLPNRAYDGDLDNWERLYDILPVGSLDRRRARAAAFMGRKHGYSIPKVQERLSETLDLAAAAIEVMTFQNRISDNFDTVLEPERWHAEGGTWSISAGALRHEVAAGNPMRWDGSNYEPYRCISSLSSALGRSVYLIKLTALTALPTNVTTGLQLFNWRTMNALWLGVKNVGGVNKLGYLSFNAGVLGAFQVLEDPAPALPIWLRIIRDPDDLSTYTLGWSTTGPETGFTDTGVAGLLTDPEWSGVAEHSIGTPGTALDVKYDDWFTYQPKGTRPFCWYVYRDPGLAGAPDMLSANAVLRKMKPAWSHAAAITSKSLLCDSLADGGCDRGPMGGL